MPPLLSVQLQGILQAWQERRDNRDSSLFRVELGLAGALHDSIKETASVQKAGAGREGYLLAHAGSRGFGAARVDRFVR